MTEERDSGVDTVDRKAKQRNSIGCAAAGSCCLQAPICSAEPGRKKQAVNSSLCCLLLLNHTTCDVTVMASAQELTASPDRMAKIKKKNLQANGHRVLLYFYKYTQINHTVKGLR